VRRLRVVRAAHTVGVDDTGLTRRRVLGLLSGAAAAGLVAGCSSGSSTSSSPVRRTPSPARSSTEPATVTDADWRALARRVHGTVRRRGDSGYAEARLLFDRRFDGLRPAAVVRVANADDVATCIGFARHVGLPLHVRSGGHSYLGASAGPGLVLDLRDLSSVTVDTSSATATLGAGIALIDAYDGLAAHGAAIPAGSCPTVGLSGLALGGGIGVVARNYGLTCDRLTGAMVVTAAGDTVTVDGSSHADLLWALRGGGGSFGVVTSMRLATHSTPPLAHAFLAWPWSAAPDVLAAWQTQAPHAPRAMWSTCHLLSPATRPGPPTVIVAAVYVGSSAGLTEQVGQLTQAIPTSPTTNFVASASYLDTMLLEAGCSSLSETACHVAAETPGGTLGRDAFVASSDFFDAPIGSAGIARLVQAVEARAADSRLAAGGAAFDALGGAVDDVAAGASAYVHRGALFDAQYTASWAATPGNGPLRRNQASLAAIQAAVHGFASGQAYQNYPDASLRDPQRAYYGANLARLIEIRRTYDPTGVFTQPQGVPLS
jgi:FAD/FMN-containing dehydrogenase